MILVKVEAHNLERQNAESKNKPIQIRSINILQKHEVNSIEKGQSFQYILLQQVNIHMEKAEPQTMPHFFSKNK